jgi:shikimate kinase
MNDAPNLIVTGFMGTGKTTVGQIVARMTGAPLIDTDAVIASRAGMAVYRIFQTQGEPAFRALERELCEEIARLRGHVVASGGGMLIDSGCREALLCSGVVVCLWTPIDDLRERLVGDPTRPLAADWEALLEKRRPVYEAMQYHIDTGGKLPEQVAEEAIVIWRSHSS